MMRKMGTMSKEELGLEGWFTPLGTYPLKDEVGKGVKYINLKFSLIKGRHFGHLQWDSMRKALTTWANIYMEMECW